MFGRFWEWTSRRSLIYSLVPHSAASASGWSLWSHFWQFYYSSLAQNVSESHLQLIVWRRIQPHLLFGWRIAFVYSSGFPQRFFNGRCMELIFIPIFPCSYLHIFCSAGPPNPSCHEPKMPSCHGPKMPSCH